MTAPATPPTPRRSRRPAGKIHTRGNRPTVQEHQVTTEPSGQLAIDQGRGSLTILTPIVDEDPAHRLTSERLLATAIIRIVRPGHHGFTNPYSPVHTPVFAGSRRLLDLVGQVHDGIDEFLAVEKSRRVVVCADDLDELP